MAKYLKQLKAKGIALVPSEKVDRVCNAAKTMSMLVCGGAIEKTPTGLYQWLYLDAA